MFLTGLRKLREGSSDTAAADLAATTLSNLEDYEAPCWRRWMQSIDLGAPIVTYPQWENKEHAKHILNYDGP